MKLSGVFVAAAMLAASPASAEIVASTPSSFEIKQTVTIEAPVQAVWDTLIAPQKWWSKDHTYSDDAANLSLDAQAPGCFCEKLPNGGSVEHAHVTYIQPPLMIRMRGSLGPLAAEAVVGTLTFALEPAKGATTLTMTYVVGGYVRAGADTLAPKVDEVMALQALNLKTAAEGAPKPEKQMIGR